MIFKIFSRYSIGNVLKAIGKVESNRMQFCDSKDSSSQPETKRYLKKTMNSACTDASQII